MLQKLFLIRKYGNQLNKIKKPTRYHNQNLKLLLIHIDLPNYSFLISSFWGSSKYFNFMVNHCHEINYQDRQFFFRRG